MLVLLLLLVLLLFLMLLLLLLLALVLLVLVLQLVLVLGLQLVLQSAGTAPPPAQQFSRRSVACARPRWQQHRPDRAAANGAPVVVAAAAERQWARGAPAALVLPLEVVPGQSCRQRLDWHRIVVHSHLWLGKCRAAAPRFHPLHPLVATRIAALRRLACLCC